MQTPKTFKELEQLLRELLEKLCDGLESPADDAHGVSPEDESIIPKPRPSPFWAFPPQEYSELERLERALREAESWLDGVTERCMKCRRRILPGTACPTCDGKDGE